MRLVVVTLVIAFLAAGCGGSDDAPTQPLRDGIYEYQLSESHLLENGIGEAQVEAESGVHTATLDGGSFVDRWATAQNRIGSCRGTYETEGSRVTFRWTSGCFGDWAMTYSIDGDVVTWSDFEALPPYNDEEERKVVEVFNDVPWTRVGDVS